MRIARIIQMQFGLKARRYHRQTLPIEVIDQRDNKEERNNHPLMAGEPSFVLFHAAPLKSVTAYFKDRRKSRPTCKNGNRKLLGHNWVFHPKRPARLMVLNYMRKHAITRRAYLKFRHARRHH